jgi:hypothetical protein
MVHLWNVRPGKPLAVGSIALLKENGRQYSRRLQLSDLLLLLLRCLLILLLAILLAQPRWRPATAPKEKGWVLMAPQKLPETYRQFQSRIDSLLQAGYALHYFTPGFPERGLQTALHETEETPADSASYWALLDSLQQHARAPSSLYLFTPGHLSRFYGDRPAIDTAIHWYAYTPADSVSSWQSEAYAISSGGVLIRKVTSRPAANSYIYEELPASAKADTTTCRITVFADTYAHDAGYLKAAITAIQQFTRRKISLLVTSETAALPPQTDWLFWLSAQALPANVNAHHIWRYDSGAVINTNSWIISAAAAPTPLFRRIQLKQGPAAQVLWTDGFGDPLLRLEKNGAINIYHFSGRLDPAWNELPWSPAFPGLLLQLLFPDDNIPPPGKDRRAIAAQQLRPDHGRAEMSRKRTAPAATDLAPLVWAVVFALFLAERLWVFKTKKSGADG